MVRNKAIFQCDIQPVHDYLLRIVITIPKNIVHSFYQCISNAHQNHVQARGFSRGSTPLLYIEQNYRTSILQHLKECLLKYCVINSLYQQINEHNIVVAGEPRLTNIILEPHTAAEFHFEISLVPKIDLRAWKHIPFKAPKRKNYKDIDRQVESFIKEELHNEQQKEYAIIPGDWICFDIVLLDAKQKDITHHKENLWIRIGDEEADIPFQEVFLDKKIGDSFVISHICLQEYFGHTNHAYYTFRISIKDVVHHSECCLEYIKHHFKLRSHKELQQKLIEIFSFRHDLSLRRTIVEESLHALITKHPFDIPNFLILRQQQVILESVLENPDYQVYKTQPNFKDYIHSLAVKQARELLIIDQLSFDENITVSALDLKSYFKLHQRPRTRELIYFLPPKTKHEAQELPTHTALLYQTCLREKTLNHVINHLTRK